MKRYLHDLKLSIKNMRKCSISYLFIQNIIAWYIMIVTLRKVGSFFSYKKSSKTPKPTEKFKHE